MTVELRKCVNCNYGPYPSKGKTTRCPKCKAPKFNVKGRGLGWRKRTDQDFERQMAKRLGDGRNVEMETEDTPPDPRDRVQADRARQPLSNVFATDSGFCKECEHIPCMCAEAGATG